jgi:small-conductance mechanosensitive channel
MPALEPWTLFALSLVVALVVAVVIAAVVSLAVRVASRRAEWARSIGRVRRPFRILLVVVGFTAVVAATLPATVPPEWRERLLHGLQIAIIAASGWFIAGVIGFLFDRALARWRIDVPDNRVARRIHTQATILRRLSGVVVAVVTVGAILLTFPGVEAVGASLLASAGLASVVAGLAAQSTLANVFAGLQLAFSDAIRVDDVVIAEGEWGRIEEITLTYVVVHIWDDRRLVLPSTYFTTTPFQNWTRSGSELLGSIELDLDWRVSPADMRDQLDAALENTTLWDGRVKVLQVTDAVGGWVRIRILVTAKDAPTLFDLRCHIRESFVEWMARDARGSLPVQRVELVEAPAEAKGPRRRPTDTAEHEGLFTGSVDAQERAATFTSAVPIVREVDPVVEVPPPRRE